MAMSGSISFWIEGAKAGCESAAWQLWHRYRMRLLAVARRRLEGAPRTVQDEEDVLVTAFHSFLARCRDGQFPDVKDRNDLTRILMTMTARKALNQRRDQCCVKRAAVQPKPAEDSEPTPIDEIATFAASADWKASLTDSLKHLLAELGDGELRSIVLYKLEGYSNSQLADKMGRSIPTIERRLRLIREKWLREVGR